MENRRTPRTRETLTNRILGNHLEALDRIDSMRAQARLTGEQPPQEIGFRHLVNAQGPVEAVKFVFAKKVLDKERRAIEETDDEVGRRVNELFAPRYVVGRETDDKGYTWTKFQFPDKE